MSEAPGSGRAILKASVWLFAALSMLASLSPLGATHDEAYHARSIWCGQGERSPYCTERFTDTTGQPVARTNIETQNCQIPVNQPLLCPTDRTGESIFRTNDGLYPSLFYYVLSWFVVPNVSVSTFLIRLVSIFIISTLFGITMWLLPPRYRLVLLLVSLTTFTSTGFFLFSSLNPSSWTSLGTGIGWLSIHAAFGKSPLSRTRRVALGITGSLAWVMALGSRWDAVPFLVFVSYLIALHLLQLHHPRRRTQLLLFGLLIPIISISLLERFAPARIVFDVRRLYSYSPGQPDNLTFFTDNLMQGLPNALRALGSVPVMSGIVIPEIVYISALGLLGMFVFRTFNQSQPLQIFGVLSAAVVICIVIAAQVALVDNRDTGGVEPRYVYPLFIFMVAWWFLLGPDDLRKKVQQYLRPGAIVVTTLFALVAFTTTERFVDRTTFGLRYLPEGPDQWWWSWMPFGPNVAVILAPVFIWWYFRELFETLNHYELSDHES